MTHPFQHVLTATDLGPDAERAVDLSIALVASSGGRLSLLHVFEVPTYMYAGAVYSPLEHLGTLQAEARRRFDELAATVRARCPRLEAVFKVGSPWEQILASGTELQADLVVVGTRGRRGIARAVLGSVAEKVVRLSPVPVLTVRNGNDERR
jgi:nucleotide-binding universal stress UspA family protein